MPPPTQTSNPTGELCSEDILAWGTRSWVSQRSPQPQGPIWNTLQPLTHLIFASSLHSPCVSLFFDNNKTLSGLASPSQLHSTPPPSPDPFTILSISNSPSSRRQRDSPYLRLRGPLEAGRRVLVLEICPRTSKKKCSARGDWTPPALSPLLSSLPRSLEPSHIPPCPWIPPGPIPSSSPLGPPLPRELAAAAPPPPPLTLPACSMKLSFPAGWKPGSCSQELDAQEVRGLETCPGGGRTGGGRPRFRSGLREAFQSSAPSPSPTSPLRGA